MTLDEYIAREIRLAKEERKPNAITLRFVELHEQTRRTPEDEDEYLVLRSLMHSRWRWFNAYREAAEKTRKEQ